ncbi:MAG: tetratricopeptide repeat protein, partial [Pirellulaceae bacterium]
MILGMIEYQRGNDAQAAEAFAKAESLRTKDPLASYYLGQTQIRLGDSSAAVASFERSLQRKPQRADELEIFQQLGRVHQRAQRTDEAMKVWKRLEELYPDEARVLEQIAVTLAEEGQTAEALPRYEKLAATSK